MSAPDRHRRSRKERTADSRALILDAAVRCLYDNGYAGTTTLTIQARAGVSRGRLLHHFPSRETLLVAAAQHLATTHLAEMENWATESLHGRTCGVERIDAATERLWSTFQQPYFWAAVELWNAARTDEALRHSLLPQERQLGAAIRHVIDAMYGPIYTDHPRYPMVRELVFTSMRGVAVTYSFDDRDPAGDPHLALWKDLARLLLEH